jgi:hypothetical protein
MLTLSPAVASPSLRKKKTVDPDLDAERGEVMVSTFFGGGKGSVYVMFVLINVGFNRS